MGPPFSDVSILGGENQGFGIWTEHKYQGRKPGEDEAGPTKETVSTRRPDPVLEVSRCNGSSSQHRVLEEEARVSDKVEATGRRMAL